MSHKDKQFGRRLRIRRQQLGLTLQELGDRLDRIHLVQVHKYETGQNRMSVSKLWEACHALNVSPDYFFRGLKPPNLDPKADDHLDAILESAGLVPELAKVRGLDERGRQAVAALINALAK